ncbi:unnamed protein product [Triticum turgidum subsp. durum]|uniref:Zinc finger-XS domain-containing protein n=1 Tax=Triticum turgidum subsp. durum TaxID=4567 RepID=A0A9R0Q457_TRITD|nr:unnamed protein product [Triticum turgidum subsp. durum]
MADARGDAGAADGDVVELQGAVTMDEVKDVGGVHGGAGQLATAADVEKEVAGSTSALPEKMATASSGTVHPDAQPGEEQEEDDGWGNKRKLDLTGFKDPYDPGYSDDEEYEYVSGEDVDVDDGNFVSFKAKEEEKIRAKGYDYYYKRKTNIWRCPYCTTKRKPKSGRFVHLVAHVEDVAIHGEDYKIRGHAALVKVLTPR